ncbi:major allergen Pru ar 1-like, partial [Olea europaea subsp. europaea]
RAHFSSPFIKNLKASIVDSHNLIPKLMPQAIKNIQIIQGNGGVWSMNQIEVAEG